MKKNIIISVILLLVFTACDKPVFEKPENLIKEKMMIEMMVEIQLADAAFFNQSSRDTTFKKLTATDFYHSVLKKYSVSDTLFERSFIYYASEPKNFEKMYRKVTSRLTEIEQEYSGRKNELLEFEESKN